ncbi:hypothetical protein FHX52_1693 [Humibacillus xanthopallidus]|uniref:Uncharacterized protein n=1 Tax=Humibacillus xanthopallidus TaxID=412689 RepID=A0A543PWV2_9MICO|nr:hypothetical protein [Humibacillus xanthopallidus]TQN48554.1 hypothetical protein FHX52_1693 [Humibacillus xanthopallidus]
MTIVETVQVRTPLAVAFHDLVSDAPITDGLLVSARRAGRGRFRPGRPTPSGAHVLSGLPFLRDVEVPVVAPGAIIEDNEDPSGPAYHVDVLVQDTMGRFLPTVIALRAPLDHVATAADALSACSSLAWSLPSDTPMFLMSAPTRALARTTAVVRASLRDKATDNEAGHAVVVVEASAGRAIGVADARGNVVVAFPYPLFAMPGTPGSVPAGTHGIPTRDQTWRVTVTVRWQPASLEFTAGLDVPFAHSVFCQHTASIVGDDGAPGVPAIDRTLRYGEDLTLTTDGVDPTRTSYLFVEQAP